MNNIVNSIRLDYFIFKTFPFGSFILVIGIAAIAGIISAYPPLILGIVLMVSAFYMGGIFAAVEKNNLDKLYGLLPVRKQHIIVGRYILTLLVGIVSTVLATVMTLGISFILSSQLSGLTIAAWLCGSFFLFCLIVSIQFPIYFKYDFSKVSTTANMPFIILFLIGSALMKIRPELFSQTVEYFIHNQYMIWLTGIVAALLVLGISMFLSSALYKRRDL